MNVINLALSLDKSPGFQTAYIGEDDMRGTEIRATVSDEGVPVDLVGATAKLKMMLPDLEPYEADCEISGGVMSAVIDAQANAGGICSAYFQITKGGSTFSTERVTVVVLPSAKGE